MKKLAVFFPGIGYTHDKPLLYYSRKLAAVHDYEIRLLTYQNLPEGIRGNRERMVEAFEMALQQCRNQLQGLDMTEYDEILFVGKSIGTIVAAAMAQEFPEGKVRMVLYTPLEDTFAFPIAEACAFTGTEDPWTGGAASPIAKICHDQKIRCISLEGGNHSLETGDMFRDLEYLKLVMQMTDKFMK